MLLVSIVENELFLLDDEVFSLIVGGVVSVFGGVVSVFGVDVSDEEISDFGAGSLFEVVSLDGISASEGVEILV